MTRTVRDVLEDRLKEDGLFGDELVDALIRDLRDVLSTGDVWKTRDVEADELEAGDVIVAKDGRLHMVTAVRGNGREVTVSIRRGERGGDLTFALGKRIPTLLTTKDDRALALLERELGATVAEREVA